MTGNVASVRLAVGNHLADIAVSQYRWQGAQGNSSHIDRKWVKLVHDRSSELRVGLKKVIRERQIFDSICKLGESWDRHKESLDSRRSRHGSRRKVGTRL